MHHIIIHVVYTSLNIFPIVNCVWNEWQIGECSKTCGGGTRTNTRTKKVQEAHGGTCEGHATSKEECNAQECPPSKQQKFVYYLRCGIIY